MGQVYLVSGKRVAMRLWSEAPGGPSVERRRRYETVGFVQRGVAELLLEGQTILLRPGDSWLVPPTPRRGPPDA
jgi:quercetin dioxygenase-like cupin family protein